MSQFLLEFVPALFLSAILLILWRLGRSMDLCHRPGWRFVLIGLALILAGMLYDLAEGMFDFQLFALGRESILRWVAGEAVGLALLTVGLWRWLPSMVGGSAAEGNGAPPENETEVLRRTLERHEEEARETRRRLEWFDTLIESMTDPVLFKDGEGRWLVANPPMLRLFQLQGVDFRGKTDADLALYSSFYRAALLACTESDEQAWRLGAASRGEEAVPQPEGPDRVMDVIKIPTFHRDGSRKGLVIVARDITEQKRSSEELIRAKETAEAASRVRSQFLTTISHEIRTPMNAIIGMGELLMESGISGEQRGYVRTIEASSESLLGLISDILDLSKSEGERLELDQGELDLEAVIEKSIDSHRPTALEKGLKLTAEIHPEVPTGLVGDPRRLRQILSNLIDNAVKFSHRGEVALRVTPDPKAHYPGVLHFAVSDQGIGIAAEQLENIFNPFTQADSSVTRSYGGAGIGLTISRRLVELMGGRLWAESSPGAGSTFHFTAHFGVRPLSHPHDTRGVDLTNLKALVIDDDATNRMILREMLAGMGALVRESGDCEMGTGELERARRKGTPYDLALMGCLGGDEAESRARMLREEHDFSDLKIVAVSSREQTGERAALRRIGCGYLLKPIKREDLSEEIGALLRGLPEVDGEAPDEKERGPLNVLLVEDSEDNCMLIEAYLKSTPHTLEIVHDGADAVKRVQAGGIDLVLMDVQMPVMDGNEATRRIRAWESEQGLPRTTVVTLTAHALKEDERQSYLAGADAYLTKPIKKSTLLETLEEYAGTA